MRNDVSSAYDTSASGNILQSVSYELIKEHDTGAENHAGKKHLDAEDHDDDTTDPVEEGTIDFDYDANGNTTQEIDTPLVGQAKITIYEYNVKDQLVRVTMPDLSVAEYKYDVYNKRIEKKVVDSGGSVVKWKRYLYYNEDIIVEYDYDGTALTLAAEYIHDTGIDNPVAMIRGGATYYYHKDGLGSVTEITDSTGAVVKTYTYKTFGVIASVGGTMADLENPYTYTSREYDSETGLYYYRARYYNAMLGRFINKDPIGISGGLNMYAYVGNDPVNNVDPTGLYSLHEFGNDSSNLLAGFGDTISFQETADVRSWFLENDPVNKDCELYQIGKMSGYLFIGAAVVQGSIVVMESAVFIGASQWISAKIATIGAGAKAVDKVSISDLKRFKRLVRNLSRASAQGGSKLTQQDLEMLRKYAKQFGANVRVDLDGVVGSGVQPHAHIEWLGTSIERWHIFLQEGVK